MNVIKKDYQMCVYIATTSGDLLKKIKVPVIIILIFVHVYVLLFYFIVYLSFFNEST